MRARFRWRQLGGPVLSGLLAVVAFGFGAAPGCEDTKCDEVQNVEWTCLSRYCPGRGAASAFCFCWTHDKALGGWTAGSCTDGQDNDGDGLTDCQDTDCMPSEACNCADGEDNDGDGLTDCDDLDCSDSAHCCSVAERAGPCCHDGLDNDGDGLTDCEQDPDCRGDCCHDGLDNDKDGKTDCDDEACAASPDCCPNPSAEACNCDDGTDNDGDGLTDCEDPDCVQAENCWDPRNSRFSERLGYCIEQRDMFDQSCSEDRATDILDHFDCAEAPVLAQTGLPGKLEVEDFVTRLYNIQTGQMVSEASSDEALIHGPDGSGNDVPLSWIRFSFDGWFDSNISKGVWTVRSVSGSPTAQIKVTFLSDDCLNALDMCDVQDPIAFRMTADGQPMTYTLDQAPEASKMLLGRWSEGEGTDTFSFEAVVLKHAE